MMAEWERTAAFMWFKDRSPLQRKEEIKSYWLVAGFGGAMICPAWDRWSLPLMSLAVLRSCKRKMKLTVLQVLRQTPETENA